MWVVTAFSKIIGLPALFSPLRAKNTKPQGKVDIKYSVKQRVKVTDEIRFCNELKGKYLRVLINDQGHLELLCLSQQYMTGAAG